MQFVVPRSINRKSKYFPRHFSVLAEFFCDIKWASSTENVNPGQWAIVVRSLGSRGLSRAASQSTGIQCAFDVLSDDEVKCLKDRDGLVVVDLGWEMLNPTPEIVNGLATTLQDLDIEPSRVFLFHSNQSARRKFNALWRQTASVPPPASIEYPVGLALYVVHQQKKRDEEYIEGSLITAAQRTAANTRSRLFVSFNGEVRPHRLYLGAALQTLGLLNRGYFSLLYPKKNAGESREVFHKRTLRWFEKLPRGTEFVEAALGLLNRLPIELDLTDLPRGNLEDLAWESQDPIYYSDSRFTIVVDTAMFEDDCLFVTEKVLKPIMNHSPFLLVGSPGGVDLMRGYGFRTFEPFLRQCDSSDANSILTSAIDEVVRMSQLDESALAEFSRGVAATCDFNAAHLWSGFPEILKQQFLQCLLVIGAKLSAV